MTKCWIRLRRWFYLKLRFWLMLANQENYPFSSEPRPFAKNVHLSETSTNCLDSVVNFNRFYFTCDHNQTKSHFKQTKSVRSLHSLTSIHSKCSCSHYLPSTSVCLLHNLFAVLSLAKTFKTSRLSLVIR